MIVVYAAAYLAIYRIITEIPQLLDRDRPDSDALFVGMRGMLSLPWRVVLFCFVLGAITAALHGGT